MRSFVSVLSLRFRAHIETGRFVPGAVEPLLLLGVRVPGRETRARDWPRNARMWCRRFPRLPVSVFLQSATRQHAAWNAGETGVVFNLGQVGLSKVKVRRFQHELQLQEVVEGVLQLPRRSWPSGRCIAICLRLQRCRRGWPRRGATEPSRPGTILSGSSDLIRRSLLTGSRSESNKQQQQREREIRTSRSSRSPSSVPCFVCNPVSKAPEIGDLQDCITPPESVSIT